LWQKLSLVTLEAQVAIGDEAGWRAAEIAVAAQRISLYHPVASRAR
jgi:hypothetical protein